MIPLSAGLIQEIEGVKTPGNGKVGGLPLTLPARTRAPRAARTSGDMLVGVGGLWQNVLGQSVSVGVLQQFSITSCFHIFSHSDKVSQIHKVQIQ